LGLHKKDYVLKVLNDNKRAKNKKPWQEEHNKKSKELTLRWAECDFETFGYKKEF
jgi:hypothetical protein